MLSLAFASALTQSALAQFSIQPLNTFSANGDGWLSPTEDAFLTTAVAGTERGLAYNPVNNHLYVASRGGTNGTAIQILSASTGAVLGTMNVTGITGGAAVLNGIGVTTDGVIYAGNIATTANTALKIYRWANELAVPQALTLSTAGLQAFRLGDNFDVFGADSNGTSRLGLGYNNTNGYSLVDPTLLSTAYVNSGGSIGFRGGISFVDSDTVWGTAGGTVANGLTRTEITGTLSGTSNLTGSGERQFDIINVAGMWLMATVEAANSTTDNCEVRIYDITNSVMTGAAGFTLLGTATTVPSPFVANQNTGGSVQWGAFNGTDVTLYAMSTNNGVQAFNVHVVPEPASAVFLLGSAGLMALRRRRS